MNLAQCKGLSLKSKLIHVALEELKGQPTTARAIADKVGISLSSVERGIKEMKGLGLVEVIRHGNRPSQYFLKHSEVVEEMANKGYTQSIPAEVTKLDEWRELMAAKNKGGSMFFIAPTTAAEADDTKPAAWLSTFAKIYKEVKGTTYVTAKVKDFAGLKRIRQHISDADLPKAMRLFIETEKSEYCTLSNMGSQKSLTKLKAMLQTAAPSAQEQQEDMDVQDRVARLKARMGR